MKEISSIHWSRLMKKLSDKGMTQDSAYEWLSNRFTVKEEVAEYE